ncbi:hypothetical protein Tco_1104495 [Tanacetum coccineum]
MLVNDKIYLLVSKNIQLVNKVKQMWFDLVVTCYYSRFEPAYFKSGLETTGGEPKRRMDYARALVDIQADRALKDPMVILVPNSDDNAAKNEDPKCWSAGGTGERVGRGGRGRRPREGNDERVDELNGQGNDQGLGANGGVEGVNGNVEGANGGAPDFSTIIA